jgi:hypothetical protein
MEFITMARKNAKSVVAPITPAQFNADVIKTDPTNTLLELMRGLNPAQLQVVLTQLKQLLPVAPVAVAPVAVAPVAVAPVAVAPVAVAPVAVAPVAPITLPTAITRDLGTGTLTTELLCIGVSPVRWGYGKPTRIVNFVHEHENIGFVSYENGTETDFRPGVRYAITATLPGKMSKEYQGVSNNIMKIATAVAI